jgi:hypothetical protein
LPVSVRTLHNPSVYKSLSESHVPTLPTPYKARYNVLDLHLVLALTIVWWRVSFVERVRSCRDKDLDRSSSLIVQSEVSGESKTRQQDSVW